MFLDRLEEISCCTVSIGCLIGDVLSANNQSSWQLPVVEFAVSSYNPR